MRKAYTLTFRIVTLVLMLALLTPLGASALAANMGQTRASDYMYAYNSYIYPKGSGKLEIWFSIDGVDDMDEIGVLSIELYESTNQTSWTKVKTYLHEDYDSMLIEDDWSHSSCVSYNGVAGRYYKADVCFWAGRNNGGDSRNKWTSVVRAS